ncbi:MAG: hypothetical protein NTZ78_14690, partial [Candidatus Aureabacteria bacterium]|nr:hypothetical protein [Candidatus Auribacterota bacterium]
IRNTQSSIVITYQSGYHLWRVNRYSGNVSFYIDDAYQGALTSNLPTADVTVAFDMWTHPEGAPASKTIMLNWVFVRKSAATQPAATVGNEELAPTPTPTMTPTPTPTITSTPTPTPTKSMDSPGLPSAGSGMYTFQQIYEYLNSGTVAPTPGPFQWPSSGPGPTMKTLKEIYEDIKAKLDECGATAADVKAGKTFFCTQPGSWGVRTGTR